MWCSYGDGGANFYVVADVRGCWESQGGWMGRRGMSVDAFEWLEEAGGVWGHLVGCAHRFAMDG